MTGVISYPIIFSAPMITALLDGRKTQTRRLAHSPRRPGEITAKEWRVFSDAMKAEHLHATEWLRRYERWQAGERPWLYVRENWRTLNRFNSWPVSRGAVTVCEVDEPVTVAQGGRMGRLRPSIHMPRWASRLSLRVTDMKMERLQDISEEDARAEGVTKGFWEYDNGECCDTAREAFGNLWNRLHGTGSWDRNEEVVAISFEVHQQNIERIAA